MARLGVDLGTTWTAAAFDDGNGVTPVKLGAAGTAMPSVVAIADGKPVAGDAAVRAGRDAPAFVAREFKRRLGDTTPIVLGTTPYGPETLTGHLLAHVVATAGGQADVAVTHPATWGEFKLDLLREAGRVAGVGEIELVPEPIAAAGHYARVGRLSNGDAVAVYDFGGGTFDAAVVRFGADGPELLGRAEGLDRLGGVDLDQAVLAHVDATLDGALRAMDRDDPAVRRAAVELRAECVAAKEALSADTEATIAVRFPSLDTDVRMTRPEFEAAVRPRVAETLGALDRAIASASLTAGDLAGVVLVGGSSRIPLVAEEVAAHTGRPNLVDADPKLAVASGAAEPHLRPPSASRPQPVLAAANMEAAMTDPDRSTTPPPPPPGAGPTKAEGPGSGNPPAPGKPPPRPSDRRTAATNAPKEKSGMSTGGKVAAGVAAAGAATAAGLLWGDQVTDALGITGDDVDEDEAAPEESMDAFDAAAPGGGGGGGGGFGGGGGGGGRGGAFAPPRPQGQPRAQERDFPAPSAGTAQAPVLDPVFMSAKAELQERLANWELPEGADPETAAELRDRLEGLLDRYLPRPGQSTQDAIAELRDEFALRIDQYTQELRLDAVVDAQQRDETIAAEFDQRRAELLERLEEWVPPEGADPDEVEALRAELEAMVNRAQPIPGQTAEEAFADLQQRFDGMVNDYVTEQKTDAIEEELEGRVDDAEAGTDEVDEVEPDPGEDEPGTRVVRDHRTPTDDEPAPVDVRDHRTQPVEDEPPTIEDIRLPDWLPPAWRGIELGSDQTGDVSAELERAFANYRPMPGRSADEITDDLLRDLQVPDFVRQQIRVQVTTPPEPDAPAVADASQDTVLVDDFDAMVGNTGVAGPAELRQEEEPPEEPLVAPAGAPETDVAVESPAMAGGAAEDVLGEDVVAEAVAAEPEPILADEPEPVGVPTTPVIPALDDLGLDLVEATIGADPADDLAAGAPEPEPVVADIPEPEPSLTEADDAAAGDVGS